MKDKTELIKKITNFHPASEAGKKRDWSYYVGGMRDSGDWYFRKLLDASIEELQECYEELVEAHNKPVELVNTSKEDQERLLKEFFAEQERRMWYGEDKEAGQTEFNVYI